MKIVNNFVKFIGYIAVHLSVALETLLLALLFISPIFNIVIGTMYVRKTIPLTMLNHYLLVWLLSSLVIWIVLFIYVEVEAHKKDEIKE